jgi:predicted aspartyl protease
VRLIMAIGIVVLFAAAGILTMMTPAKAQEAPHYTCPLDLHRKPSGAYTVSVDIGRHVMPPGVAVEVMLDTGFSGALTLPRTLVNRLSANGLVMHNMGKFTGVLANGSVSEYDIVFVGDVLLPPCQEFNFLAAVVTDDQAPILIGQEILSGYLSANIDYDNRRLVLEQLTPFSTRLPRCLWPSKQSPDCPQLDPGAKPFFYHGLKSAP